MPQGNDPAAQAEFTEINDPIEPLNRGIFAVNRYLDGTLIKPAAGFYRGLTPPPVQAGVSNFLDNLSTPVILLNDLLQGEMDRARTTLVRFLINTTVGFLGFGDPAEDWGYAYHDEDFGQTLAVWGAGEGPYLMLPVFGPSNPRDGLGIIVDFLADPFNWWAGNTNNEWAIYARSGAVGIDTRHRNFEVLNDLEKSSLDYYAAIRSLYRQHRKDAIENGTGAPGGVPGSTLSQGFDGPAPGPTSEQKDPQELSQAE